MKDQRGIQPDVPQNVPDYHCPKCGKSFPTFAAWEWAQDFGCQCGWKADMGARKIT